MERPLDFLAKNLGIVAGQIEREMNLRITAAISDLERRDAERELRLDRLVRDANDRISAIKSGKDGKDGKDGEPGKFVGLKEWSPGVHYDGELVTYGGSTYCANKDTAQIPQHEDWNLVASRGSDAPVGQVHGLYTDGVQYRKFDLVAFNGCEWRARRDDPGEPGNGDGWALAAKQGKKGDKGDRGDPGRKGDQGNPGPSAIDIRLNGFLLNVMLDDGSIIECDLRPAFEKYHIEAVG